MSSKKRKPEGKPDAPRMKPAALKEFVMAYCNGNVTHTRMMGSNLWLITAVFIPLAIAECPYRHESIGLIYEYNDADGRIPGRAVNGFRMFTSVRFMHVDDVARVSTAIDRELKRRAAVRV